MSRCRNVSHGRSTTFVAVSTYLDYAHGRITHEEWLNTDTRARVRCAAGCDAEPAECGCHDSHVCDRHQRLGTSGLITGVCFLAGLVLVLAAWVTA